MLTTGVTLGCGGLASWFLESPCSKDLIPLLLSAASTSDSVHFSFSVNMVYKFLVNAHSNLEAVRYGTSLLLCSLTNCILDIYLSVLNLGAWRSVKYWQTYRMKNAVLIGFYKVMAVAQVCGLNDLHVINLTASFKVFLTVLVQRWCICNSLMRGKADVDIF